MCIYCDIRDAVELRMKNDPKYPAIEAGLQVCAGAFAGLLKMVSDLQKAGAKLSPEQERDYLAAMTLLSPLASVQVMAVAVLAEPVTDSPEASERKSEVNNKDKPKLH